MSICPACAEPAIEGASFCEACGADLPAVPGCVACDAAPGALDSGYCLQCGHRQPEPRDHLESADGRVVGATDKGNRHHRNEDAMAMADTPGGRVLVVCDGVSTTDRPEEASQAAADAAVSVLRDALAGNFDPSVAFQTAVEVAQDAVASLAADPGGRGHPSCTFVAAVVPEAANGGVSEVHVGWLGDSRAYWVGEDPELLTRDHSWALEMEAGGHLSLEEALADPRANTITRFLGADALDLVPSVITYEVAAQGTLVVCSDGLWNYAPEAAELAARQEWKLKGAAERAAGLTAFALEAGGHDNITTVITDVDPAGTPAASSVRS